MVSKKNGLPPDSSYTTIVHRYFLMRMLAKVRLSLGHLILCPIYLKAKMSPYT